MYLYDEYDQRLVDERVAQYRGQTARYLAGKLSDDEFRPLRLQNGLYVSVTRRCCASPPPTAC
jgi:sulfite reductase (NADPH) hemoprotein beta-component